jgi:hypothetical protein
MKGAGKAGIVSGQVVDTMGNHHAFRLSQQSRDHRIERHRANELGFGTHYAGQGGYFFGIGHPEFN